MQQHNIFKLTKVLKIFTKKIAIVLLSFLSITLSAQINRFNYKIEARSTEISQVFLNLLNNPNHSEWIDCHVERGSPPATYYIIEEIQKFTK